MLVKVNPLRFKEQVDQLCAEPSESGKILLYGSSFFTVWGHERAARQMNHKVINNGFGGSTAEDLLYYYQLLVKPFHPASMILRTGVNDLGCGYTAKQAAHSTFRVAEWAALDFDGIKIGLLPSFDCPWLKGHTKPQQKEHQEFNERLEEYASDHDNVVFLDIRSFFYEDESQVGSMKGFKDIFTPDGLHLLDCGYEQFAPYFYALLQDHGFIS